MKGKIMKVVCIGLLIGVVCFGGCALKEVKTVENKKIERIENCTQRFADTCQNFAAEMQTYGMSEVEKHGYTIGYAH